MLDIKKWFDVIKGKNGFLIMSKKDKAVIESLVTENIELKILLDKAIISGGHSEYCKTKNMHPYPDEACVCHYSRAKQLINS